LPGLLTLRPVPWKCTQFSVVGYYLMSEQYSTANMFYYNETIRLVIKQYITLYG
jgi:hypothetical protein